jgi:hypothetical protein
MKAESRFHGHRAVVGEAVKVGDDRIDRVLLG